MKMSTKKKVLAAALIVSLIAILSFGTLAWFNATDTATNTFKIAKSDDPSNDPDFKVEVFETDENGDETDGLEFTDVAPGAELDKDPTVRNTGDYGLYARLVVTLSDAATWKAAATRYSLATDANNVLEAIVDGINAHWVRFDNPVFDATADTLTYVYYYDAVVAKAADAPNNETEPLFTKVEIPGAFEQSDMDYGTDGLFTVTVRADAVQSDNILDPSATVTGNEAYQAFSNANWAAGTDYPSVP